MQVWYPNILSMSIKSPILLSLRKDPLKYPKEKIHPLVQNKTLQLVAWTVSGLNYKRREFLRQFLTLSLCQEDQVLIQIMNQLGESGLLGVLEIFFWFMEKNLLIYTSKDSNTGLLVKIDVQIWLWWTGARKACRRMECVLCLQEFLIADPTTKILFHLEFQAIDILRKVWGRN